MTSVDNELLVGLVGETLVDADLAARCMDALDADRFVPKGAVSVDVVDGWVTLSGHVRRHFQRQAAKFAVQRVSGVRGITDNVVISATRYRATWPPGSATLGPQGGPRRFRHRGHQRRQHRLPGRDDRLVRGDADRRRHRLGGARGD